MLRETQRELRETQKALGLSPAARIRAPADGDEDDPDSPFD
jgi:hypothetical protein